MLRAAAITKPRHVPAARPHPIPAPIGGLNAKDSIADMPETDALVLDNFFPQPDYVELRRGYESHATGLGAAVESLMEWAGPASRKLFGAASTNIFEVTSAGAVGAADVSSMTNARWQHTMQATSGGNFLIIANGADSVRHYDGSSWAVPTITGVTSSTLDNVWLHKERLWFVEQDTLNAWYLGTKAIAGAATEFPLGSIFKQGGTLLAGGSLTRDGGAGPDDFCVFVTTTGEVAIYQGTDPASASTWAIVGLFQISPPIGKRCLQKAGGDLAVITEGGIVSLTTMLSLDRSAQERAAITSKINREFSEDARSYRTNHGWQIIGYPRSNMILINIPTTENSVQHQHVMNSLTGSWGTWSGLNASCWSLFSEDLYFGGNSGTVWKADTGFQDNGNPITADLKSSFNGLGLDGFEKTMQMVRAMYSSNGSPGVLFDINVDYADQIPTSSPTPGTAPGSVWDAATWDTSTWEVGEAFSRGWFGATGTGHVFAVRMRVVSDGASFLLYGFDTLSTTGGMV